MNDLFISHASEDKDELVRPLAERLKNAGVDVWYDEYTIRPGDSLSASIDKGLIECQFGLIVLSPAFFQKKWTDYELKSLLTKEVYQGKTIIPIWHNVGQKEVAARSLYLADKKALSSSEGIKRLSEQIVLAVRPDIINSHLIKHFDRALRKRGKLEYVPFSDMQVSEELVHKRLPKHLVLASKMIDSAMPNISSFEETLIHFAKDHDYDREYLIWCVITASYLDSIYDLKYLPMDHERNNIILYLIDLSLFKEGEMEDIDLPPITKQILQRNYAKNASLLYPIMFGDEKPDKQTS